MITAIEIMTLGRNVDRVKRTIMSGSYVVVPQGTWINWTVTNMGLLRIAITNKEPYIALQMAFLKHEVLRMGDMFPHTNGFPVIHDNDERVFGSKKLHIPRMR